jgi:hypothetical protein
MVSRGYDIVGLSDIVIEVPLSIVTRHCGLVPPVSPLIVNNVPRPVIEMSVTQTLDAVVVLPEVVRIVVAGPFRRMMLAVTASITRFPPRLP